MALPFPSLRDMEIQQLEIPYILDQSETCFIFLWATIRKVPLAREILLNWGERSKMLVSTQDICWVKLNQLNRLVSAGRTGYYFNHAKETYVMGIFRSQENSPGSGTPTKRATRFLRDSDVIFSKVKEVSRKTDELYDIIEQLVGKESKKLELFGRNWNIRPYWTTVGNQISKTQFTDDKLKK